MTPPKLHMHLEELFSAGMLATSTVGDPGAHGAAVTGVQGIGVSAPRAAAVAEATAGLAMELHIPNGAILTNGLLSIILAIGMAVIVRLIGSTLSMPGARPNEHCSVAPPQTS
jgi:hypothetical protein